MTRQGQGATQHSPLLDKGAGGQHGRHEMTMENHHSHHNHPPWLFVITVDLINLLMTSAEIALVLYLTYHHIEGSRDVIAVAMLTPILLNFVGVTYFFSDKRERDLFENVGTTRITKDFFQVPVFGPVFTALKVLLISLGLSRRKAVSYERFETSAVKMRQAQTFFSASPEAMVQLSVLLITTDSPEFSLTHLLEVLIVIVCVFTLAEANVYALRSNYFRLFHTWEEGDWEVHETFWRKCILFFHSFTSIGSRIAAAACLIAGAQCYAMRDLSVQMEAAQREMMQATAPVPLTPLPPHVAVHPAIRTVRQTYGRSRYSTTTVRYFPETSTFSNYDPPGFPPVDYNPQISPPGDYNPHAFPPTSTVRSHRPSDSRPSWNPSHSFPTVSGQSPNSATTAKAVTQSTEAAAAQVASQNTATMTMAQISEASTRRLAMVIVLTILGLIIYNMIIYYIARLVRHSCMKGPLPGGCYESINYGWRSTILHTGFQSKNIATQIWFYCENCAFFAVWWFSVNSWGNPLLKRNTHIPMTFAFIIATVLSIFLLFAAVGTRMHRLESPLKNKSQGVSPSIK